MYLAWLYFAEGYSEFQQSVCHCLQVIAAGEHVINGKKVDPKKAKARHGKIFVGGLSQEISDDDIKNYFSQFGNVSCLSSYL